MDNKDNNIKILLDTIYHKGISIEEIREYYSQQRKKEYDQFMEKCAEARTNMLTMLKKYLEIVAPDINIDFVSFIKQLKNIEKEAYKGNIDIKKIEYILR